MKRCNHKWVRMEDGTSDKLCVRCRTFAKQATAKLPEAPLKIQDPQQATTNELIYAINRELSESLNQPIKLGREASSCERIPLQRMRN